MTELERMVLGSRRLSAGTRDRYRRAVRDFIAFAGADPSAWTPAAVEAWYAAQLRHVKPQTARVRLGAVRYASRRLSEVHGVVDFARAIEPAPSAPPTKRRALTDDEVKALLAVCDGPRPIDLRDQALVRLGLATGARRAGLAGIRLRDFGTDDRHGHRYVEITLKGGRRHRVPVAEQTMRDIDPWLRWRAGARARHDSLFVTFHATNITSDVSALGPLSADGIYRALRARAERAGITFSPHSMRTTLITRLRSRGVPPHVIAAITGHRVSADGSSAMIESTYYDSSIVAGDATRAVDNMLRGIP